MSFDSQKVIASIQAGSLHDDSGHQALLQSLLEVALSFPETPAGFEVPTVGNSLGKDTVVLVSGGQDSTIMMELTKDRDRHCIFVDVGQPYAQAELRSLKGLGADFTHLTRHINTEGWKHIIPGRNLVLLLEAEKYVNHEGEIWLGVVEGESEKDKGDKSDLFFHLFEEYIWRTKRKKITIRTLAEKTKNDWLKWYIKTTGKIDILSTVTCFHPEGNACGQCQACVRKFFAFIYCGIETEGVFKVDPLEGGLEYILKYKKEYERCLQEKDFSHYSKKRCEQDLEIIRKIGE